MTETQRDIVRRRFERDALSFDSIYRLERSPFWRWFNTTFRKGIFRRYDITFAEAGDLGGKTVLDVGCGSGVYCVDFARRGARRVMGVDFSAAMLELARKEAASHGVAGVCEFTLGDFAEPGILGNPGETFDLAIAMGVFDYLPDPAPFLRKMVSLTRGKVIASFPGHSPIRERLRRLRYRLQGKGGVHFYSEAEVRSLAEEAGMRDYHLVFIPESGSGFVLVGSR